MIWRIWSASPRLVLATSQQAYALASTQRYIGIRDQDETLLAAAHLMELRAARMAQREVREKPVSPSAPASVPAPERSGIRSKRDVGGDATRRFGRPSRV